MQYYSAFFRQNGGCGYVLKPSVSSVIIHLSLLLLSPTFPQELRPSQLNYNENKLNGEATQLKLNVSPFLLLECCEIIYI